MLYDGRVQDMSLFELRLHNVAVSEWLQGLLLELPAAVVTIIFGLNQISKLSLHCLCTAVLCYVCIPKKTKNVPLSLLGIGQCSALQKQNCLVLGIVWPQLM